MLTLLPSLPLLLPSLSLPLRSLSPSPSSSPLSRIRYCLLLREVIRFTPETHEDYVALQDALKSVQDLAGVCV